MGTPPPPSPHRVQLRGDSDFCGQFRDFFVQLSFDFSSVAALTELHPSVDVQVLAHGQLFEQRVVLGTVSDATLALSQVVLHALSADQHIFRGGEERFFRR